MYFFRLRNLKRDDEKKKEKQKIEQTYHFSRQRRGAKVFKTSSPSSESEQLTAPSRLFERTSLNAKDSLDEINLQIPRFVSSIFTLYPFLTYKCTTWSKNMWRKWEMRYYFITIRYHMKSSVEACERNHNINIFVHFSNVFFVRSQRVLCSEGKQRSEWGIKI